MLSPETLAITYGISSAVTWGAGDFSGGFATKRNHVFTVILLSQIVGGVLLVMLALLFAEDMPHLNYLLLGALAGIFGALGLVALYSGLAKGRMGIVAPTSAVVTGFIPIIFAFFNEGLPPNAQILGFFVALLAVWLLSSSVGGVKTRLNDLILPVAAGAGFGLFFILIDRVSDEAILWPLVAARLGSLSLVLTFFLARRRKMEIPAKGQCLFIALAGIFDTGGNAFFALATRMGRLDTSAILSSLYPAATVMLAWLILKERLSHKQWFGVVAALSALILIAA